jgi:hypothetical protein
MTLSAKDYQTQLCRRTLLAGIVSTAVTAVSVAEAKPRHHTKSAHGHGHSGKHREKPKAKHWTPVPSCPEEAVAYYSHMSEAEKAPIMLDYRIATGIMSWQGRVVGHCHSGNGVYRDNPKWVTKEDSGPLPPGEYYLGEPYNSNYLYPDAIPLWPLESANVFGRFHFHIIEIKHPQTKGCIDMPDRDEHNEVIRLRRDKCALLLSVQP